MSPLDPVTWPSFAQGFFAGIMLVLLVQTAWRHRPSRESSWRHVRDDFEPISHVWLVHPDDEQSS